MAKRRKRRRISSRRRSRAGFATLRPRLPRVSEMSQTQIDALGLGLVGAGVFFGFVFYDGWDGGKVGETLVTAFTFVLGAGAYSVPVLLAVAGLAMIVRPLVDAVARPLAGVVVLVCSLTLGFTAGS